MVDPETRLGMYSNFKHSSTHFDIIISIVIIFEGGGEVTFYPNMSVAKLLVRQNYNSECLYRGRKSK